MSREVRRVPVGWRHPVEPNPYGRIQELGRKRRGKPESRLLGVDEQFVPLYGNYAGSLTRWEQKHADLAARQGGSWTFSVEYHLTGYQGRAGAVPAAHPFYVGEDETPVPVRDEDHLHELLMAQHESERPDPADYMPDFGDQPLGWCLYETVSEGTPVTPVFATAEDLVEHLCTVGQDWDQVPLRREAAETIVRRGGTMGSLVVKDGHVYRSAEDADVIAGLL